MSDNVYEAIVAKEALRIGGPTAQVNFYVLSESGAWQGPFESVEHAAEDATISGRVVSVSVCAELHGFLEARQ